jgi:putative component of toxin-antitoxin plasmid stabilization module
MFDGQPKRVLLYETPDGTCLFNEWFTSLRDREASKRIYVALAGEQVVLLLCGGDKTIQQRDINQAHAAWREYQNRAKQ